MKPKPAILLSPLALLACTEPDTAPTVGMANPASVYCVKQGGTLEMRDETRDETGDEMGGTVGYCRLPDGSVVEEWAYFRANTP